MGHKAQMGHNFFLRLFYISYVWVSIITLYTWTLTLYYKVSNRSICFYFIEVHMGILKTFGVLIVISTGYSWSWEFSTKSGDGNVFLFLQSHKTEPIE